MNCKYNECMDDVQKKKKSEPKKRYASNATAVTDWIKRLVILGIVVGVGLALWHFGQGAYLLFAGANGQDLIYSTKEGLGYCAKGGERTAVFKLVRQNGEPIAYPKFAVLDRKLVYYSPEDTALCVVTPGAPVKWITLGASFRPDMSIKWIRKTRDGVAIYGWSGIRSHEGHIDHDEAVGTKILAAADVDLGTETARAIPIEDRITDPAGDTYIKHSGNSFTKGSSPLTTVESPPSTWDYDFASKTLVSNDGKAVTVITPSGKKEWSAGALYYMQSVSLAAAPEEVWIEAVKPINAGYMLIAYKYDGTLKNVMVKDKNPIMPPYVKVDQEMADYLKQTFPD